MKYPPFGRDHLDSKFAFTVGNGTSRKPVVVSVERGDGDSQDHSLHDGRLSAVLPEKPPSLDLV